MRSVWVILAMLTKIVNFPSSTMCTTTCKEKLDYCHEMTTSICFSPGAVKTSSTLPQKPYLTKQVRITNGEGKSIHFCFLLTSHCRLVPLAIPARMFITIDLEYKIISIGHVLGTGCITTLAPSLTVLPSLFFPMS